MKLTEDETVTEPLIVPESPVKALAMQTSLLTVRSTPEKKRTLNQDELLDLEE